MRKQAVVGLFIPLNASNAIWHRRITPQHAIMSEESYEITQHATIGPIKGLRKTPGVIQYLGVQYATLKDRFSRGELLQSYPASHLNKQGGVLNATKFGYEMPILQCTIFPGLKDDRLMCVLIQTNSSQPRKWL